MIVPCECGAKLKVDDAKIKAQGIKVRCPRCGNIMAVRRPEPVTPEAATAPGKPSTSGSDAPLILVAHDSEAVRDSIESLLTEEGYKVDTASNGFEAMKKVGEKKPQGMVLDVGLPGIYGFEVCERLKGNEETSSIKIVLLSSVYDMRRYKRTPVSLYGADDYIEKHHLPDKLPGKLRKLLAGSTSPEAVTRHAMNDLPEMARPPAREFHPSLLKSERVATESSPSGRSVSNVLRKEEANDRHESKGPVQPESFSLDASIFQKEECDIPRVEETDPDAVEKARRFARIIVSDIALYNQEAVAEGLKNGTFYELLKGDVDEGRELYENRVPPAIRAKKDYYREAFDNFINGHKKNAG